MEKDTEHTVTTQEDNVRQAERTATEREASGSQTLKYVVYFVFGLLEILLALRFVLRLLGANPESSFVAWIYDLSAIFVAPFEGIFRSGVTSGVETTAVFEPATLIAMVVYAIVAWAIVKLIQIFSGKKQS